ncbi:MAG: hypothetical protein ACSLE6_16575 [Mycobacterium sp.]
MTGKLRAATACSLLVLSLTACTSGVVTNPLAQSLPEVFPSSGLGCVDAAGPNSTAEQIAAGLLEATERTMQYYAQAVADAPIDRTQQEELAESMEGFIGLAEEIAGEDAPDFTDPDVVREMIADSVFEDVPAGGDAAYAAAVCELPTGWLTFPSNDAGALGITDELHSLYRSTSHAVRSTGRATCDAVAGYDEGAEAWVAMMYDDDETFIMATEDPAEYIQNQLDLVEDQLDDLESGSEVYDSPLFGGREAARWSMMKTRDYLRDLQDHPQTIATAASALRDADWAAIEHQCPQFSSELATVNAAGEPTLGREEPISYSEGFGVARPDYISFGGSVSSTVSDIEWESWGEQEAVGFGTGYSGPDPYEVYVIAFDLGTCDGHSAYRMVTLVDDPDDFDPDDDATDVCP